MSTNKAKFAREFQEGIDAFNRTHIARAGGPDANTAGVNVLNVTGTQVDAAPPTKAFQRTVNADGTQTKPQAPAIISKPGQTVITGGSPLIQRQGADLASIPTMPQSDQNGDFVAIRDMAEIGGLLRPGEIERLGAHGINPGVRNGLLSLQRQYVPAAIGILRQARGQYPC